VRHNQKIQMSACDVFEVAILFVTTCDRLRPPMTSEDRASHDYTQLDWMPSSGPHINGITSRLHLTPPDGHLVLITHIGKKP